MDLGDWIFEALLTLGWTIWIEDSGIIHAEPASTSADGRTALHAIIQDDGAIAWESRSASRCLLKRARIRALRTRVAQAKRARRASHAPLGGRARPGR